MMKTVSTGQFPCNRQSAVIGIIHVHISPILSRGILSFEPTFSLQDARASSVKSMQLRNVENSAEIDHIAESFVQFLANTFVRHLLSIELI